MSSERLLSAQELREYDVQATDGKAGRIEDLLLDDDCSRIVFFTIALKGLFSRKEVLAPPRLVSKVDWATSTVYMSANRRAIESSQEHRPAA